MNCQETFYLCDSNESYCNSSQSNMTSEIVNQMLNSFTNTWLRKPCCGLNIYKLAKDNFLVEGFQSIGTEL